jgi:outer membrane receptor protein involved in Fe transport
LSIALALGAAVIPVSAQATAEHQHYQLNIPRQSLGAALNDFAKQTGLQIARFSDAVDGSAMVGPVTGDVTLEQALNSLLDPQGLSYKLVNDRTIAIVKPGLEQTSVGPGDSHALSTAEGALNSAETADPGAAKKAGWFERFRVAQNEAASPSERSLSRDEDPSQSSNKITDNKLEEIVVTATKRAESEFHVPLSMEVITGKRLNLDGMANLDDLSARVPNVTFGNGLTQASISIRGMGSGADRSFEQSVAMFIDDVYMPRSRQYRAPFFDMARVEILRGPQALMFGLNATAGSVNITTATTHPGDKSFLEFSGGYESEFQGFNASAIAGGTLGSKVGARLAVRYVDTGDGNYFNQFTSKRENKTNELVARGTLDWKASDVLTFMAKVNYAKANEDGNFGEAYGLRSGTFGDGTLNFVRNSDARYLSVITDKAPGLDHELLNASVRFDDEMNGYVLTGIGAYSRSDYDYFVEIGNLPAGLNTQGAALYERFHQYSGELHLASPAENTLSYIVGVYAANNKIVNNQPNVFGNVFAAAFPPGATALRGDSIQATHGSTLSGFASLTWKITDTFRLTGGARYSHEEKDNSRETPRCEVYSGTPATGFTFLANLPLVPPYINLCGTLPGYYDKSSNDNLMPELVAQWDLSGHSTVYAKVGKSAKASGYAFSRSVEPSSIKYNDETANGAEIGLKSVLLDGRASFNLAAYYTRFKDLQLTSFVWVGASIIAAISNAGESVSKGVEADFTFAAKSWLTVGTSLAYLNSEYTDYLNGVCYIGETATRDPVTGACDKTGQKTPNAPEFSGSMYADVAYPLSNNFVLTGGATLAYSDRYFTDATLNPAATQDSYARWDARVGLRHSDGSWEINVIGKNLSNEAINSFTQPISTLTFEGYPSTPRTITLQGTLRF